MLLVPCSVGWQLKTSCEGRRRVGSFPFHPAQRPGTDSSWSFCQNRRLLFETGFKHLSVLRPSLGSGGLEIGPHLYYFPSCPKGTHTNIQRLQACCPVCSAPQTEGAGLWGCPAEAAVWDIKWSRLAQASPVPHFSHSFFRQEKMNKSFLSRFLLADGCPHSISSPQPRLPFYLTHTHTHKYFQRREAKELGR